VGSANLKTAYFNSPCQGKTIKNIATGAAVHCSRASCRFPRATKWAEGQGEGFVPSMVAVYGCACRLPVAETEIDAGRFSAQTRAMPMRFHLDIKRKIQNYLRPS
jgi:hypothetical protein